MGSFLRTPHGILLIFGCLLLGVAGFTAFDSSHRTQLETIVWPSSAGNTNFFQPKGPLSLSTEIVRQKGRPFYLLRVTPVDGSDAKMFPAGRDDTGAFTLYQKEPLPPEESAGRLRYIKVARHRYLQLVPAPNPAP